MQKKTLEIQETDIAPSEIATPQPPKKRKGKWRRRILRFLAVLFGIPAFIVLLLQFSPPQTFVAGYALDWLSTQLDFKIKAKRLHLDLINSKLSLDDVQILDRQGKTMIAVEQLHVDFDYRTVLKNGDIYLKDILLKRGAINLIVDKKTDELNIVEFIERIEKLTESKEPRKDKTPSVFGIHSAKLEDVFFSYHDNTKPYAVVEGMDYSHFGLEHIYTNLQNLRIVGDTVAMQLRGFKAREHKTQLEITNFTTDYRMTKKTMDFRNLHLAFGNSVLRKNLFMRFDSQKDLSDFVNKVTLVANLDSTVLDTRDLQIFAPALKEYKDVWQINGILRGRIHHFTLSELHLGWGKGSTWQGNATMRGLPDIDSTYMNLDFREAKLVSRDLLQYINQKDANEVLEKLGEVAIFKGLYKGYISDFEAGGSFQTALGEFDTQMRLMMGDGSKAPYYKLKINTPDLQIGKLLGLDELKNVAVEGDIEGSGFTPETAKLTLDTKIKFADFNDYRYQDIEVVGTISHQRFEGNCYSKDANLDFDMNGTVDFNPVSSEKGSPPGRFVLTSKIRNIDLQALHFMPTKTTIKGNLEMDLRGLHIDSLAGWAILKEADIHYAGKDLHTKQFDLLSEKRANGERQLIINSDYLILDTEGKFYFSDIMRDLPTLAHEYWLSIVNKKSAIEAYYSKKKQQKKHDYHLKFDVILNNINPIIAFFDDKLSIAKGAIVHGEFIQQRTSRLNLFTEAPIDSIFYGKNKLYGLQLDLTSSKLAYDSEVLAALNFTSDRQHVGGMDFDSTSIDASWGKEGIDFDTKIHQSNSSNRAKLMGMLQLQDDTTLISFTKSDLQFYNDHWAFDKNNELNINPLAVSFKNVILRNQRAINSFIGLQGAISDSIPAPLQVELKQIDIGSFAQIFKIDANGSLNGNFTMANLLRKPDIKGDLMIENLMYREMLIGDVDGSIKWIDDQEKLDIDLTGFRKNRYILSLMGGYYPNKPNEALDLEVKLNRTDLEILEPFADEFISKVGGNAQGKIYIKGKTSAPDVSGNVRINNGRFKFNMLNTNYDIDGDIVLKQDEIVADSLSLTDEYSNPAMVNAKIYHSNFQHFYIDTDARFYAGFQVMNTEATPNCLYYGTAFASGKAKIQGFLDNLTMTVNAKTQKGTKIVLPLDGYEEVGAKDYIHFVTKDKKDSLALRKVNLGGVKLKFNLDVTPNAEFDIIIDSRTGDKITAKGKGNIEMDIDTKGDLSIRGKYVIQQGKYNFTFANLINKGFNIDPGSSIQFNGDMYASQLDVRAIYDKHIPLSPLVDLTKVIDGNSPEYRRPYSVKATLDMKGNLFSPEIKLGLDLTEAKKTRNTNLQTAVMQLETQISTDEQERNRQVFSLLILHKLSQPNSFSVTGQDAGGSLSELISNQFSNWVSQVDENLELNFNVSDVANPGSYQLRVSYNFLDGKLRLTREGGFTNAQNQADVSNIVGDWTLEYLLTNSGRFRLKTYRRNNTGIASIGSSNLNGTNTATVGFSLMHTAGFNRLVELFAPARNRINAKTGTGGLRGSEDTNMVIFEENMIDIPTGFVNKQEPIVVEDFFPFKRRMDTLQETRKQPHLDKPTTQENIDKNKTIPSNNGEPQNNTVNENAGSKKKNTGELPLSHRYGGATKSNTTHQNKPKKDVIPNRDKTTGELPLIHRHG